MDIGTKQYSEMYGVSIGTVSKWCREGLIEGATQDGKNHPWHIPKNSPPPYGRQRVRNNRQ